MAEETATQFLQSILTARPQTVLAITGMAAPRSRLRENSKRAVALYLHRTAETDPAA